MNNDEDLLDIIARQRLNIYHQERRIEALEKSLSQATQPTMTNDLVNQLFNQLQTSNELMALKAKCERLTDENVFLKLEVERLKNNAAYLDKKLDEELDKGGQS
jgi:wobble nucleotide-excising tRNase